jgi:hypothetical protein
MTSRIHGEELTVQNEQRQMEIAKEVCYEWKMLCWTYESLRRRIGEEVVRDKGEPFLAVRFLVGTSFEECTGSASLEPFLLHVRNLRDFLYKDRSRDDDVLAVDFFDDPDVWRNTCPPMGDYLKSIKERLNKAFSHISYSRLAYRTDKRWNIGQIRRDLSTPWKVFLEAIPTEKESEHQHQVVLDGENGGRASAP